MVEPAALAVLSHHFTGRDHVQRKAGGLVVKKTAYVVFAINLEGRKEVLGIWIGVAKSSKFLMIILTDLRARGVQDILIASVDGLNGFEEAIWTSYPKAEIQRCIVHQLRNSTRFVNYKDRKQFCNDMKEIYTAPTTRRRPCQPWTGSETGGRHATVIWLRADGIIGLVYPRFSNIHGRKEG